MKRNMLTLAIAGALLVDAAACAALHVRNDAITIESLQNKLLELDQAAKNVQARADAERRALSEDEDREIQQIFADFEATENEIARRARIAENSAKLAATSGRRTQADDADGGGGNGAGAAPTPAAAARPGAGAGSGSRERAFQTMQIEDRGKWGFRSMGEFMLSVLRASNKGGGGMDPRLVANAPTTYGQEGVGADGGFAVPPDFRTAIVTKVMAVDGLLGRTDQQTSSSNSITFPADETTPWQTSGGVQCNWEVEAGQKGQSKPSLVPKTVKLNKLTALVPMTDELLEDAASMANYVNRKAPEKITFKVNDAIINGTGAGQPLGILKSPGTIIVAAESGQAADTVLFQNIVNVYNRLTPAARMNAVWLLHPDVEAQLQVMQFPGTGTAVPVYMPPGGLADTPYGRLMGRPVLPQEASPALGDEGDILFGDLQQYLSVVKAGGIRQDVSIHLWFDYDVTAFRFVLRIGGQPWWNAPITAFQAGAATRGFFVALGARD